MQVEQPSFMSITIAKCYATAVFNMKSIVLKGYLIANTYTIEHEGRRVLAHSTYNSRIYNVIKLLGDIKYLKPNGHARWNCFT